MAPVYKLKYFEMMGSAEPIRYMLEYGKVQYEDMVIDKNQWPVLKKTVPFGEIPILEVDNKVLFHSVAICRFLAKRFGLVFNDEMMTAMVDSIAETVYDFGTKIAEWHREDNQTIKDTMHKELESYTIPTYMKGFENTLMKNGGFFGGKLSWVDLYFVAMMETIEGMLEMQLMEVNYPTMYELVQKVRAIPTIKSYLEKRPHFDY